MGPFGQINLDADMFQNFLSRYPSKGIFENDRNYARRVDLYIDIFSKVYPPRSNFLELNAAHGREIFLLLQGSHKIVSRDGYRTVIRKRPLRERVFGRARVGTENENNYDFDLALKRVHTGIHYIGNSEKESRLLLRALLMVIRTEDDRFKHYERDGGGTFINMPDYLFLRMLREFTGWELSLKYGILDQYLAINPHLSVGHFVAILESAGKDGKKVDSFVTSYLDKNPKIEIDDFIKILEWFPKDYMSQIDLAGELIFKYLDQNPVTDPKIAHFNFVKILKLFREELPQRVNWVMRYIGRYPNHTIDNFLELIKQISQESYSQQRIDLVLQYLDKNPGLDPKSYLRLVEELPKELPKRIDLVLQYLAKHPNLDSYYFRGFISLLPDIEGRAELVIAHLDKNPDLDYCYFSELVKYLPKNSSKQEDLVFQYLSKKLNLNIISFLEMVTEYLPNGSPKRLDLVFRYLDKNPNLDPNSFVYFIKEALPDDLLNRTNLALQYIDKNPNLNVYDFASFVRESIPMDSLRRANLAFEYLAKHPNLGSNNLHYLVEIFPKDSPDKIDFLLKYLDKNPSLDFEHLLYCVRDVPADLWGRSELLFKYIYENPEKNKYNLNLLLKELPKASPIELDSVLRYLDKYPNLNPNNFRHLVRRLPQHLSARVDLVLQYLAKNPNLSPNDYAQLVGDFPKDLPERVDLVLQYLDKNPNLNPNDYAQLVGELPKNSLSLERLMVLLELKVDKFVEVAQHFDQDSKIKLITNYIEKHPKISDENFYLVARLINAESPERDALVKKRFPKKEIENLSFAEFMMLFNNPKDRSILQQETPSLEDSVKFLKATSEDEDSKRIAKIKLYCEANIQKLEGGEFAQIIALLPSQETLKIELIEKYFAAHQKMKVDDFLSIISSTSQALPERIGWAERFFGVGLTKLNGDDFLRVFGKINYPSRHEVAQAYCRESLATLSVKNLAQILSEILKYVKYETKIELITQYFKIHPDILAITLDEFLSFNKEFVELLQGIEKAKEHFAKSLEELKSDDFIKAINHLISLGSDPSIFAAAKEYCEKNIDKLTVVEFAILLKLLPDNYYSKKLTQQYFEKHPDSTEYLKNLSADEFLATAGVFRNVYGKNFKSLIAGYIESHPHLRENITEFLKIVKLLGESSEKTDFIRGVVAKIAHLNFDDFAEKISLKSWKEGDRLNILKICIDNHPGFELIACVKAVRDIFNEKYSKSLSVFSEEKSKIFLAEDSEITELLEYYFAKHPEELDIKIFEELLSIVPPTFLIHLKPDNFVKVVNFITGDNLQKKFRLILDYISKNPNEISDLYKKLFSAQPPHQMKVSLINKAVRVLCFSQTPESKEKSVANLLEKIYPDELERAKFLLECLSNKSLEDFSLVAAEVVKNIENLATIRELIAGNDKDLTALALANSKFAKNFSAQMPLLEERSLGSIGDKGVKILANAFGDKFNPQDLKLSHVAIYCAVFANSESLVVKIEENDRLNISESIKGFLSREHVEVSLEDKKLPDLIMVMADFLLKNPQALNRQNEVVSEPAAALEEAPTLESAEKKPEGAKKKQEATRVVEASSKKTGKGAQPKGEGPSPIGSLYGGKAASKLLKGSAKNKSSVGG